MLSVISSRSSERYAPQTGRRRGAAYLERCYLLGFQALQVSLVKPGVGEHFRTGPAGSRLPEWWRHDPESWGLRKECELPRMVPSCPRSWCWAVVEKRGGIFSLKSASSVAFEWVY